MAAMGPKQIFVLPHTADPNGIVTVSFTPKMVRSAGRERGIRHVENTINQRVRCCLSREEIARGVV